MRSNYKQLGKYIRQVDERNTELGAQTLLGVSIEKVFMPSIANIIGTDMSTYKKVRRGQFAYGPVTSRNGNKISIAFQDQYDEAIVSQAYVPFEVIDAKELLPEYLMMWFRRPEFDRYARFKSHGSAREIFDWDEMCKVTLPVPHPDKQKESVKEYNAIVIRIHLNNQLIQKLEETAQAIYKQWFVDFEFPDENGQPYKSSGGELIFNEELEKEVPKGWVPSSFTKLAALGGGGTPSTEINEYWDGDVLFYTPGDLTDYYYCVSTEKRITKLGLSKCSSKLYPINTTFVTARGATVGGVGLAGQSMAMNQTCYAASGRKNDAFFVHQLTLLTMNRLKKEAVGATFEALVTKDFDEFIVLKPTDDTIQAYELKITPFYSLIFNLVQQNQKLSEVKGLLLSKISTIEN